MCTFCSIFACALILSDLKEKNTQKEMTYPVYESTLNNMNEKEVYDVHFLEFSSVYSF